MAADLQQSQLAWRFHSRLQQSMYDLEIDHVPLLRHLAEGVTAAEVLHEAGIIYATEPDLGLIDSWIERWLERTSGSPNLAVMQRTVPAFTPRNWVLQLAIDDAERGDWAKAEALAERLMRPFERLDGDEDAWWSGPRPYWALSRPGCSMLSCSS